MGLVLLNNGSDYQQRNYFSNNRLKNFIHTYPLKKVLELIDAKRYEDVLDVGCGDGILLPSLCRISNKVYGTDIQPGHFEYIKKYRLKNLFLYKDDIQQSRFRDNRFDLILCIEALEHMPSPDKAVLEIHRILKRKGTAVISMPIEIGFPLLFKYVFRVLAGYKKGVVRRYQFRELIKPVLFKKTCLDFPRKKWGHKDFDYRVLVDLIKKSDFRILNIKYLPVGFLGPNLSYRVIIKIQKK